MARYFGCGGHRTRRPGLRVTFLTSSGEVVATMAEKKLGSMVVVQNGKVAGIFTARRACFSRMTAERHPA